MEIAEDGIKTMPLDHHGLVAAVCRDLGLADKIDSRIKNNDPRRIVSTGTAAVAMILNGLGFTNRRLYLTPQFFESKPTERLLKEGIEAKHLDDHALGKALMEGIGVVQFFKKNILVPIKEIVANLSDLRKKIIRLFGKTACQIYGIT